MFVVPYTLKLFMDYIFVDGGFSQFFVVFVFTDAQLPDIILHI